MQAGAVGPTHTAKTSLPETHAAAILSDCQKQTRCDAFSTQCFAAPHTQSANQLASLAKVAEKGAEMALGRERLVDDGSGKIPREKRGSKSKPING